MLNIITNAATIGFIFSQGQFRASTSDMRAFAARKKVTNLMTGQVRLRKQTESCR